MEMPCMGDSGARCSPIRTRSGSERGQRNTCLGVWRALLPRPHSLRERARAGQHIPWTLVKQYVLAQDTFLELSPCQERSCCVVSSTATLLGCTPTLAASHSSTLHFSTLAGARNGGARKGGSSNRGSSKRGRGKWERSKREELKILGFQSKGIDKHPHKPLKILSFQPKVMDKHPSKPLKIFGFQPKVCHAERL